MKTCDCNDHLPYEHMNMCTLWFGGKDLAFSARGPSCESGVDNFFSLRSIVITFFTVGGA